MFRILKDVYLGLYKSIEIYKSCKMLILILYLSERGNINENVKNH